MSTPVWQDERVVAAQQAQLSLRDTATAAGARRVGWKVGFGTSAAMASLGTTGPLVGFLTDATQVEPDAVLDLGGWATPRLEPELAVHLGSDLAGDATEEDARAAVAGVSAAFEMIDLDPHADLAAIVAGNIFHRGFAIGPAVDALPETLTTAVSAGGEPIAESDDATAAPGAPLALLRHVAAYLAAFGERLQAGDVVITGSTVPALALEPGTTYVHALDPVGTVAFATGG